MTTAQASAAGWAQRLALREADRMRAYRENLDFYEGRQWPARSRSRTLTFNYARTLIHKTASYVLNDVSYAVEPPQGGEEAARRAEAALARVADEHDVAQIDFDTEIDASVLGDGAYKVWWDAAERRVRVTTPDVQGLYAWWSGDDTSRVWRVVSRYRLSPEEAEALHGTAQSPRKPSAEVDIVEVWTDARFELWVDDILADDRPNPYGFIPFVLFPNLREPKRFWGTSDLESVKEPLRELNRALTQLSSILEISGNPIAVLENVQEARDIAVEPGAVWELPEKARAYLLDLLQGGGVQLHVEYVHLVYRALHDLAEAPRAAFGEGAGALSGVALNIALDPLLKKVQRKRLIRGSAHRRRNEMALRLLEQFTGESFAPYRSRVLWGPVLPQDRSRLIADERTLVDTGIHSRRRAASELGVEDPQSEFERWMEEERERARK